MGEADVDPRTITLHPSNPKIHPPEQDAVVDASLTYLGWLHRVVINQTTGHLLDGEDRVTLALRYGEPTVPVTYVAIPAEDEGAALLLLDQTAALAQPHPERWAALRAGVQTEDPTLLGFWAGYAEEQGWAPAGGGRSSGVPAEVQDAELSDERLAQVRERWPVEPGEIWACGRHRLTCGDALDPAVLERLLAGVTPTMVLADPPYGVSMVQTTGDVGRGEAYQMPCGGVAGETKRQRDTRVRVSGGSRVHARTGHYPIEARGTDGTAASRGFKEDPRRGGAPVGVGTYAPVLGDQSPAVARQAVTQCRAAYPRAVQVWWGANYYSEVLPASSCWLVWSKETTGHFADCELAWTNHGGAVRSFTHRWNGMLRDSERERRWHPTQKPAALLAWVYETLGAQDDVVLDPFLGSGPSLLAAEQRGRTVYGCDLSPDNCSIALERWSILSGGTPQRLP